MHSHNTDSITQCSCTADVIHSQNGSIHEKSPFSPMFVRKLCMQKDTTTNWITKGGNFQTSKKCKTTFILKEFYENKSIEWNLHVDSTPGLHQYDMILGRNIMSKLGITLNFKNQTMTWDNSTINMKDPKSLSNLLDPVNDFFWSFMR